MMSVESLSHPPHPSSLPGFRFVDPEEFCRLVVSTRPLQRCDDPRSGLRGLSDVATGEQFFVEDLRLSSFLATRRPK
ncbi:MAG: hypothetical protein U0935_17355 [Pirellulales bacterium]